MTKFWTLALAATLTLSAGTGLLAQSPAQAAGAEAAEAPEAAEGNGIVAEEALTAEEDAVEGLLTYLATEVDLDEFLWLKRPIVIFANTPADPAFMQQVRYIEERAEEFVMRDVVVVIDTDPAAQSQARQRLRPRGFMLAIIGKDGEVKQRRPAPRSGRELMAVIDRFPLRRQEILEQLPAGRD
jgi:hypothetical protein